MSVHATAAANAERAPGSAPEAPREPRARLGCVLDALRGARLPSGFHAAPPGFTAPPEEAVFGHVRDFKKGKVDFIEAAARAHGDAVPLRMGYVRFWLISDPAMIAEVLTQRASLFRKDIAIRRMRVFLGGGLLSSEGEDHDRKHRIAQPTFRQSVVDGFAGAMVDAAERAVASWRDGAAIDVSHEMSKLALEIAADTLFGREGRFDKKAFVEALSELMPIMAARFTKALPAPLWLPTADNRRFLRAMETLNGAVRGIIAEKRAHISRGAPSSDLLGRLMASAPDGRAALSDVEVRDEVMTLLLAGHETTANALTFTLRLLTENPAALARAQAEVDALTGGPLAAPRRLGAADVPRLDWTQACFQESMRLFPPAFMLGREACLDLVLGGRVPVRKGSIVGMSQYVVHRDPRWWKDPTAYRPERFTKDAPRPAPFTYFPFGGGKRACIGRSFAMLEGPLVLATLLSKVEVKVDVSRRQECDLHVTLRPRGGMPAVVRLRTGAPAPAPAA